MFELDRLLLYLTTFGLAAALPAATANARRLVRLTSAALVVVCLAGLLSRLYPELVGSPLADREAERLSWPLGYWNGLGLAAAMALVLALHLASDLRERVAARILAAASMPAVAATMFLTLSRGAFGAAAVGLVLLVVLGRARGLPAALAAAVPGVALAFVALAGADALTTGYAAGSADTVAAGRALGWQLVLVCAGTALLRLAALPLDRRLEGMRFAPWPRRRVAALTAGLAVVALTAATALDLPGRLEQAWDAFRGSAPVAARGGERLLAGSADGRIEFWGVAWEIFRSEPLHGTGAGTYVHEWARLRPIALTVQDAHSLYLELLGELGLIGLALLAGALLVPLACADRRRRDDRALWGAVIAVCATWLLRAGIDYDWESPALALPVLALLGTACARDRARTPLWAPGSARAWSARAAAALALFGLALAPAGALSSQRAFDRALRAYERGDCEAAGEHAQAAQAAMGSRPEPAVLLGYCAIRAGAPERAETLLADAVRRDPDGWEGHYGLALARAAAGRDPRPELSAAARRNPLDGRVRDAARRMRSPRAEVWRREAPRSPVVIP